MQGKYKKMNFDQAQTSVQFGNLIDLAAARLGGKALAASDEFFAEKENLLKPGRGVFIPEKYTERGKWMDGWESRRKRVRGHDWCIVELGAPGKIHVADIDTNHFLGNHPPFASLDGLAADGDSDPIDIQQDEQKWTPLLQQSPLKPGSQNLFHIENNERWTHVRLNIFPDGGVARLRIYGQPMPRWSAFEEGQEIDLASIVNGAKCISCSDMFFSEMNNLIMPGEGKDMSDGWETKRKRIPGNDWVIVKLAAVGKIQSVEIDTKHFKGNFPDRCSLEACLAPEATPLELSRNEVAWTPMLPETKLAADKLHRFSKELHIVERVSHVRLNIFPDGGISRLRIYGIPLHNKK